MGEPHGPQGYTAGALATLAEHAAKPLAHAAQPNDERAPSMKDWRGSMSCLLEHGAVGGRAGVAVGPLRADGLVGARGACGAGRSGKSHQQQGTCRISGSFTGQPKPSHFDVWHETRGERLLLCGCSLAPGACRRAHTAVHGFSRCATQSSLLHHLNLSPGLGMTASRPCGGGCSIVRGYSGMPLTGPAACGRG